jgi:hypothetical protein
MILTGWRLYVEVALVGIVCLLSAAILVLRWLGTRDPNQPPSTERPWWVPADLRPSRRNRRKSS